MREINLHENFRSIDKENFVSRFTIIVVALPATTIINLRVRRST